jgi:hypothetical protein
MRGARVKALRRVFKDLPRIVPRGRVYAVPLDDAGRELTFRAFKRAWRRRHPRPR